MALFTIFKRASSSSKLATLSRGDGGLRRSNDLGPNKSASRTSHGIWTVQVKGIAAICFLLFGYHHLRQGQRSFFSFGFIILCFRVVTLNEYLAVGNMQAQGLGRAGIIFFGEIEAREKGMGRTGFGCVHGV
ncbi:hypothetical protein F5B22DRAFT_466556 [Xylaria bambusicola]|uniref:uncharacterized protein n=1 Tax=Xylaria bambusicola TaxID=326684 RepID=UPI002008D074|nr:uncharacterized protein F5B22DRAFT_466556 [Xylaria bambusicola]KAI0522243.1 hypothetical protein F5B22DRAFT_466556 [Xylaria bambusicola]